MFNTEPSYGTDSVPPPASYNGGPTSYLPSYGGGGGYGGDPGGVRGGSGGGGYGSAPQM